MTFSVPSNVVGGASAIAVAGSPTSCLNEGGLVLTTVDGRITVKNAAAKDAVARVVAAAVATDGVQSVAVPAAVASADVKKTTRSASFAAAAAIYDELLLQVTSGLTQSNVKSDVGDACQGLDGNSLTEMVGKGLANPIDAVFAEYAKQND
jgi:hypothetical protein